MTTKDILATGKCGLQINLNLMDMYELSHLVKRWEDYIQTRDTYEEWSRLKDNAGYWRMSDEDKNTWNAQNPEPCYCVPNFFEEVAPVLVFLRKLSIPDGEKATVFEEETGA